MPGPIKRPHRTTIECSARSIIKSLFDHKYDGYNIRYNTDDIIKLLNDIGTNNHMIEDIRLRGETLYCPFLPQKKLFIK